MIVKNEQQHNLNVNYGVDSLYMLKEDLLANLRKNNACGQKWK